jgi:hypothetical protein
MVPWYSVSDNLKTCDALGIGPACCPFSHAIRTIRRNYVVNETATIFVLSALTNFQDIDLCDFTVAEFDVKPLVLKIAR